LSTKCIHQLQIFQRRIVIVDNIATQYGENLSQFTNEMNNRKLMYGLKKLQYSLKR